MGYAHVDPTDPVEGPSGELVIHPALRRRGHGRRLLRAVLDRTGGTCACGRTASIRAPGPRHVGGFDQGQVALADAPLPVLAASPAFELPEGYGCAPSHPVPDEEAWVAVNAARLRPPPRAGRVDARGPARREQEPWFDPAGFFLAVRGERRPGRLPLDQGPRRGTARADRRGVRRRRRPRGAGRRLGNPHPGGLAHLRSRGLAQVMLYVDESNAAAIRLYEGLGFTPGTST